MELSKFGSLALLSGIISAQEWSASPLDQAALPYPVTQPCSVAPLKGTVACDGSKTWDERVDDLVARVPAADRANLFSNRAWKGVPSLNIPEYNWWSEALHGVSRCPYLSGEGVGGCCFKTEAGERKCPSSFPAGITTSASFNKTLFRAIGTAIGTEARVASNVGEASLTFWTPNINIFRDPRWGRGQETPGEDPVLNGDYAEGFVRGFQEGEDSSHLKASACCKHFAGYSLENWEDTNRHIFDAIITEQDLADTYYPAFMSCASRGKASGVMCSYNAINGVPSCASKHLLTDLLREEWGFDGYVTSDCGAVADVLNNHKFTKTTDETCNVTLSAGMDSDCGVFFGENNGHLQTAIADGAVSTATWTRALKSLFRVQMRLGMFDDDASIPYRQYGPERVDTQEHRDLTLEAARQGLVLAKNDGVLPLSKKANPSLAVVGPSADATKTMLSNYHGFAPYTISPSEALKNYSSSVSVVHGCSISGQDASGIGEAVAAAAAADVTVVIVGLDWTQEREGHDRTNITLPGVQEQLIADVSDGANGPVVLVIMSGGPVDISAAKANPKIGAIVIVGYPGQSGGLALAEALFGEVNPSGRLTQTWYKSAFTAQCSMKDMNMRPNATTGCPGRSYRFFTGEPVFKFGHGLSYTTFAHHVTPDTTKVLLEDVVADLSSSLHLPHTSPPLLTLRVQVRNTGLLPGAQVVLGYVQPPQILGAPIKSLRRYERVFVEAGETKNISLAFTAHDLSLIGRTGLPEGLAGEWVLHVGETATQILIA